MKNFDAIVIGAGQAGPPLAARMVEAGMQVALVERDLLGGTCVNYGCMPTKALVASARTAHVVRQAAHWGMVPNGPVQVDMPAVKARAAKVSKDARDNLERWLGGMEGLTLIRGHARLEDAHTVRIGTEALTAPRIILNVGARTLVPPTLPGLDRVQYLTSSSILELEEVPDHLLIIGGSYIGLEFAQMYRRFGAQVTIVERSRRLLPREDADISEAIQDILEAEGIEILTGAACIGVAPHPEGIALHLDGQTGEPAAIGSHLLVAAGRRPNTDGLGLDSAGVATDSRGYITVDDRLATNVPGIWALGDCNGRGAFTHTSYNDFEILAANLLDNENRGLHQRIPAYALYIDPPLGRAGMTEAQAHEAGHKLLVSKRPMSRVGRAIEKGETQGFMKVIADAETQQILGAAILGVEGDEAIHGLLDAMSAGNPYPVLRWAVPVHPTVSELIPTLLLGLKPEKG